MVSPFKTAAVFLFVVNTCLSLSAQTTYNLDIEEINANKKPAGWLYGFSEAQRKEYPVKLDSVIKQHGKYSLSIEKGSGGSFGAANYSIKSSFEGKKLKLTGYVKTENVAEGYAGLWMRIDGDDDNTLSFDNMSSRGITGTTDWKEYTIELEHHEEDAVSIIFGGLLAGNGKMWIDNLQLLADGKPVAMASPKKIVLVKAKTDTAFNNGSRIDNITLTKQTTESLTNLGMLWGFLKYYHPSVAKGDYNWDAELFRVLPKVLAAGNKTAANKVLEEWVDMIGKPAPCTGCKIIQKGENTKLLPDYGNLFKPGNFNKSLAGKLEYIKDNRNQAKHYYINMMSNVGNPEFKNENAYRQMMYPDAGYRLLALYRYWNMIQYFFPYKHLIGEDWNGVLPEFIPAFINAKHSLSYYLACLRLIARIHDTHANIWGNNPVLNNYFGIYHAPVQTKFIENKLVVTGYYTDTLNIQQQLKIGDIVTKVDNVTVEALIKKFLPETPASNYETQLRSIGYRILRGNTPAVNLEIDREGQKSSLEINRFEARLLKRVIDYDPAPADSSYKIIEGNIGYVYPGKYKNSQLPAIKKLFQNTRGIIVDMRCYPSEFMPFTFGGYIKVSNTPFVKFTGGRVTEPGLFETGPPLSNGGNTLEYYKGKIVVIVNATSQSQAEYTTMAFQSSPNVTVIGSTTAGADGNVSRIVLPGDINTMISGIGVYYPNGTETQRSGVKIDIPLKPTIRGIKEGRDELLEKAVQIINSSSSNIH